MRMSIPKDMKEEKIIKMLARFYPEVERLEVIWHSTLGGLTSEVPVRRINAFFKVKKRMRKLSCAKLIKC